jgi:hypothetical protein
MGLRRILPSPFRTAAAKIAPTPTPTAAVLGSVCSLTLVYWALLTLPSAPQRNILPVVQTKTRTVTITRLRSPKRVIARDEGTWREPDTQAVQEPKTDEVDTARLEKRNLCPSCPIGAKLAVLGSSGTVCCEARKTVLRTRTRTQTRMLAATPAAIKQYAMPQDRPKALARAIRVMKAHMFTVDGNTETGGEFTGYGIKGVFYPVGNTLRIEIVGKPAFVTWSTVDLGFRILTDKIGLVPRARNGRRAVEDDAGIGGTLDASSGTKIEISALVPLGEQKTVSLHALGLLGNDSSRNWEALGIEWGANATTGCASSTVDVFSFFQLLRNKGVAFDRSIRIGVSAKDTDGQESAVQQIGELDLAQIGRAMGKRLIALDARGLSPLVISRSARYGNPAWMNSEPRPPPPPPPPPRPPTTRGQVCAC